MIGSKRNLLTLAVAAYLLGGAPAARAEAPPPLPLASTTRHSITLEGRALAYTATAGALTLTNTSGARLGEMAFVAFAAEGVPATERPITFVFGGGPGYSVGSLMLQMAGPRRLVADGAVLPAALPALKDNPESWLAFTDLVFVDPIGVGWSQSALDRAATDRTFFGWKQDIEWLSWFVARWLAQAGRLHSPKFLAGESYGGFRVPQVAHRLQVEEGVGVSGMIMISPVIDYSLRLSRNGPLDWATRLPVMAAARIERDTGRDVDVAALQPAFDYAFGEYLTDLMRPRTDAQTQQRLAAKVSALTGLDPALVRRMTGRIDPMTFNRELRRSKGQIGSRYDASALALDPYSEAWEQSWEDPGAQSVAPIASAMTAYALGELGWRPPAPYRYADRTISKQRWEWPYGRVDATGDLRRALALDPELRLLVAHGATDFVTPYLASRIILDQFPPELVARRVDVRLYAGGHGFYERTTSRAALLRDVRALYAARVRSSPAD